MAPILHGLKYQHIIPKTTAASLTAHGSGRGMQSSKSTTTDDRSADSSKASSHEIGNSRQQLEEEKLNDSYLDPTNSVKPLQANAQKPSRRWKLLGGHSPFPYHVGPTVIECYMVHDILSAVHKKREMPETIPPPSQSVAGCGEVSFVLEALVRTLISTHTHMSNADKAIRNVCSRYPVFQSGDFAGSVDWNAVRIRGADELAVAIRPAGKPQVTSQAIMAILESVKIENDNKRELLRAGVLSQQPQRSGLLSRAEILGRRAFEVLKANPEFLTLDYLHLESSNVVFERLQQFRGVGVKTAACILLFCFQYPAFAVDTHVWRLCKFLGWVPSTASRDETFFYLDPIIPNELKYGLHQLFIAHGKDCKRCNGKTYSNVETQDVTECVIEHLVCRTINDTHKKKEKRKLARGVGNVVDQSPRASADQISELTIGKKDVFPMTMNLEDGKAGETETCAQLTLGNLQGTEKKIASHIKEIRFKSKSEDNKEEQGTEVTEATISSSEICRKKRKVTADRSIPVVGSARRSRRILELSSIAEHQ